MLFLHFTFSYFMFLYCRIVFCPLDYVLSEGIPYTMQLRDMYVLYIQQTLLEWMNKYIHK